MQQCIKIIIYYDQVKLSSGMLKLYNIYKLINHIKTNEGQKVYDHVNRHKKKMQ
jgi:hypothetical protein